MDERSGPGTPRFHAVVLAQGPHANVRVAGLTLAERAVRVARKLGAVAVHIVANEGEDLVQIARAFDRAARALPDAPGQPAAMGLLVIDGSERAVHMPLATPLLAATARGRLRVAVDAAGGYAGALFAADLAAARELLAGLAQHGGDDASWQAAYAEAHPNRLTTYTHGDIAAHLATSPYERKAAEAMLFGLVNKSADNAITRYLYRPVARPLTKVLLRTPITPNQVSVLVGIIGAIGCFLVALGTHRQWVIGAALVVIAGYLDCCDGEIARLKHLGSKGGAWLDTVVDELTSLGFLIALGLHVHHRAPAFWVLPALWVGVAACVLSLYVIYYFDVRVAKTGNSQNYVSKLAMIDEHAEGPALVAIHPTRRHGPAVAFAIQALYAVVRRDFVNLACLGLAIADLFRFNFALMVLATVIMALVVVPDHVRLRGLLARYAATGRPLRYIP